MTTSPAFTAADVAALAELIRPRVEAGFTVTEAVELGRADNERDWSLTKAGIGSRFDAFFGAFAGTYDEFRAEAVARGETLRCVA